MIEKPTGRGTHRKTTVRGETKSCLWCQARFYPKQDRQEYCKPGHQQMAANYRHMVKKVSEAIRSGVGGGRRKMPAK